MFKELDKPMIMGPRRKLPSANHRPAPAKPRLGGSQIVAGSLRKTANPRWFFSFRDNATFPIPGDRNRQQSSFEMEKCLSKNEAEYSLTLGAGQRKLPAVKDQAAAVALEIVARAVSFFCARRRQSHINPNPKNPPTVSIRLS